MPNETPPIAPTPGRLIIAAAVRHLVTFLALKWGIDSVAHAPELEAVCNIFVAAIIAGLVQLWSYREKLMLWLQPPPKPPE